MASTAPLPASNQLAYSIALLPDSNQLASALLPPDPLPLGIEANPVVDYEPEDDVRDMQKQRVSIAAAGGQGDLLMAPRDCPEPDNSNMPRAKRQCASSHARTRTEQPKGYRFQKIQNLVFQGKSLKRDMNPNEFL